MLAGAGRQTEESSGSSCVFLSPRATQPVPLSPRQDHPRDSHYTLGALWNIKIDLYGGGFKLMVFARFGNTSCLSHNSTCSESPYSVDCDTWNCNHLWFSFHKWLLWNGLSRAFDNIARSLLEVEVQISCCGKTDTKTSLKCTITQNEWNFKFHYNCPSMIKIFRSLFHPSNVWALCPCESLMAAVSPSQMIDTHKYGRYLWVSIIGDAGSPGFIRWLHAWHFFWLVKGNTINITSVSFF